MGHKITDKEIELLKIYYPIGDWDTIHRELPNISKQSIHSKMSSLGISMKSYYWSIDDEKILIENYESMYGHVNDFVDLFKGKFSYKSIISKARKLGLKTRNFWSEEEISILTDNYSYKTLDEMLKLLPRRNRNSIIKKANSLAIVNKKILDCQFSESEKEYIVNNYKSMTDKEIAIELNRNEHNISDFRHRNNLSKVYETSSYNDLSEYIRRNNAEWKKNSMSYCGYKCVLTGKRFDDIHHIYSLNLILEEVLLKLHIDIKDSMNDYTDKELREILDLFRIKQNEYPLGVCLTKEIHMIFHNKYGYGNNTEIQWNEFVTDFKNGKYNNELNVA